LNMGIERWFWSRNLSQTLDGLGPFLHVTATTAKKNHAENG